MFFVWGNACCFFWCILGGFTNSLLQEGETSVTVASACPWYVATPLTSCVRAPFYRVVGIIHIATSGRDKVVILRDYRAFYMF